MISKLPAWIEFGAFILAFVAGSINSIGLLGFEHQMISHVSGTATQLGVTVSKGAFSSSLYLISMLAAFFIGASLSGFLVRGSALQLGRHYDTALVVEAGFIFLAFLMLSKGSTYGHFAASTACGIQNALATTYSGAIVRTTHLTGLFTDLGIMLGEVLRGEAFDKRKANLFLLIVAGFISGSFSGAFLFNILAFNALLAPAFICLTLAVCYRLFQKK